ncbi:hypothetical protein MHI27_11860 [Paenibacillus sp. FSL H8-0261]|uniref:hypothetical protein n=1 Tax=Paenibacillus sp. FSL H8-0261 TaxID=2921381 RepID=UPI003248EA85
MWKQLRVLVIVLLIALITFIYFYFKPDQPDIIKTLISTLLGGLITVLVAFNVNSYTSKQKSVLERKKNIYIPINKEFNNILSDCKKDSYWRSLNRRFEMPITDEILNTPYEFLPTKLSMKLNRIKESIDLLKTIDHYSIAKDIILLNFEEFLRGSYGEQDFKVFKRINEYDVEEVEYTYPKPYTYMEGYLSKIENIDKLMIEEYENVELYNSILKDYRTPLLFSLSEIYQDRYIDIGEYIFEFNPLTDDVFKNDSINFKRGLYEEITDEINDVIVLLKEIFISIHKNYEKDKY